MAASVTLLHRLKMSNAQVNIVEVAFDGSYPTGGESVTPAQMGLTSVDAVMPLPASGYVGEYDETNEKLKVFYADYNAVSAGALIEVANATDLSALTVKVIAIGK